MIQPYTPDLSLKGKLRRRFARHQHRHGQSRKKGRKAKASDHDRLTRIHSHGSAQCHQTG